MIRDMRRFPLLISGLQNNPDSGSNDDRDAIVATLDLTLVFEIRW